MARRKPPRKKDAIASAPSLRTASHVHSTCMRRSNESDPLNSRRFTNHVCAG